MNSILTGYLLCVATVFGVIALATLIQKVFKTDIEVSRKLIHTFVAFTWIPMYFYLRGTVHFIIVPVVFTVINYLAEQFHLIKSMERPRDDGRHDWGTVYYAVCMTILSVVTYFFPAKLPCYGMAVFALSFGDGAAALAGSAVKAHNITIMKGKSLIGSIACVAAAFCGMCLICAVIGYNLPLWKPAILSFIAAVLELFGGKFDNFTVSLGTMAAAWFIV